MNVREHLNLPKTEGEVGIEVEVEGHRLNIDDGTGLWKEVEDPSLRGENVEYVLRNPVPRNQVVKALADLKRGWVRNRSEINETERAGIHVHINMQEESIETLGTFITLYYCFETLLMRFCGSAREGNLFCLRTQDAENVIDRLLHALDRKNLAILKTDRIRYASLNLKALPTYGSLEFRGMRSTPNFREIKVWIEMLLSLKDAAKRYGRPSEIPQHLSMMGCRHFIEDVFGRHAHYLLDHADYHEVSYDDMRRTQEIAYSPHWSEFKEVKRFNPDKPWDMAPIGRVPEPDDAVEDGENGAVAVPVPEPMGI